jgi:hypothetical protein
MLDNVRKKLQELEEQVNQNALTSFTVYIKKEGLLVVTPGDNGQRFLVPLTDELLHSLQMFFYNTESIEYGTFDYTSLASIIHAKEILERILQKPHIQDS